MQLRPTPLRSKDGGELIKKMEAINAHWKHFKDLLNQDSAVDDSIFTFIPQHPIRDEFGIPPTLEEGCRAIKQLKNKASAVDGIAIEIYKQGERNSPHSYTILL